MVISISKINYLPNSCHFFEYRKDRIVYEIPKINIFSVLIERNKKHKKSERKYKIIRTNFDKRAKNKNDYL